MKNKNAEVIFDKKITKLLNKYDLIEVDSFKLIKKLKKITKNIELDDKIILHLVAKNNNKITPHFYNNKYILLKFFIEVLYVNPNNKDKEGRTFIYYLLNDENFSILGPLLDEHKVLDIDLYTVDNYKETLLHNIIYNYDNNTKNNWNILEAVLLKTQDFDSDNEKDKYKIERWKEFIETKDNSGKNIVDLIVDKLNKVTINSVDYLSFNYCLKIIFEENFEMFSNLLTDDKEYNIKLLNKYFNNYRQNPLSFVYQIEDEKKCEKVIRKLIGCNIFNLDFIDNNIGFVNNFFGNKTYRFIYKIIDLALSNGCMDNFNGCSDNDNILINSLSNCNYYVNFVDLYVLLSKYGYERWSLYCAYNFYKQVPNKSENFEILKYTTFEEMRFDALNKILNEISKENDFKTEDNVLPDEFIDVTNIYIDRFGIASDYELMNMLMSKLIQKRMNSINDDNIVTKKDVYYLLNDVLNEIYESPDLSYSQKDSVEHFTPLIKKYLI